MYLLIRLKIDSFGAVKNKVLLRACIELCPLKLYYKAEEDRSARLKILSKMRLLESISAQISLFLVSLSLSFSFVFSRFSR